MSNERKGRFNIDDEKDRGPVSDRSYHRDIDVCEIEHGSAHHLGHDDVMMVMMM